MAAIRPVCIEQKSRQPRVLLLGNYRPTLAIARALAPLGYRVLVAGRGGEGAAEYSRYAEGIPGISEGESGGILTCWRDPAFLTRMGIDIVLPVEEIYARQIAENPSYVSAPFLYATPAADVVKTCLDKSALYQRCHDLGVPVEPFVAAPNRELWRIIEDIGLPCVIRPKDSTQRIAGEKALIVESPAQLDALQNELPANAEIIVQKKANGPRENLYFAASNGRLIGICQAHIARTDRLDGSGLAVEGITVTPDERLVRWTQTLTQALSYTGIGCAQFLVDKTGAAVFLEINPRIPGNHAIAEAAGLPLARLSIELAQGKNTSGPMMIGRKGIRFVWTYGDIRGLREAWRAGKLSYRAAARWAIRIIKAGLTANLHMTFSLVDPLPTLVLIARHFGLSRVFERKHQPQPSLEQAAQQ